MTAAAYPLVPSEHNSMHSHCGTWTHFTYSLEWPIGRNVSTLSSQRRTTSCVRKAIQVSVTNALLLRKPSPCSPTAVPQQSHCNPVPDQVLWTLTVQWVLFSRGVFFSQTPVSFGRVGFVQYFLTKRRGSNILSKSKRCERCLPLPAPPGKAVRLSQRIVGMENIYVSYTSRGLCASVASGRPWDLASAAGKDTTTTTAAATTTTTTST